MTRGNSRGNRTLNPGVSPRKSARTGPVFLRRARDTRGLSPTATARALRVPSLPYLRAVGPAAHLLALRSASGQPSQAVVH
jgi:hypothetical protein